MSYTQIEEKALQDAKPITLEKARMFASQFGKATRSVVSKSVSLKIYQAVERPKGVAKTKKIDLRKAIEKSLSVKADYLNGLEGGTYVALDRLLQSIP
tara:strand:+ start:1434 stop:1727 length:294 start_codon:yes stop_codon:yes gene_type:complete